MWRMSNFKFVHCADLHLGSRFSGVRSKDPLLAKRMTDSTFDSFSNIIDLVHSENADFLVISGDVFDSDYITPGTRYRYTQLLERAKVPCYIARGNHDNKTSWEESIPLPPNAYEFGGEPERFICELRDGGRVEISGISFTSSNTHEDLANKLEGSKGMFTVGCVHCDVDSAEGLGYAPCKLTDLVSKDIDYWALGHIHKREVLHERPYVIYPGNPQGRNIKESGEKGAYLVTVTGNAVTDLKFVPTNTILWERKEVDITEKTFSTFVEYVASMMDEDTIVRLIINGRGPLDRMLRTEPDDVIKAIQDRSGGIIESLELNSKPEETPLLEGNDLRSGIAQASRSLENVDRAHIIEAICSTNTSKNYLQAYFEELDDDELMVIIRDAGVRLLERFSEAAE